MKDKDELNWLKKLRSADELSTPYMFTDLSAIQKRAESLRKLMPRVEIFYAIKSNNDPNIIKVLDECVDGFDIASAGEFEHLNKLKIKSNRIVYSNPVKVPDHIKQTYKSGVRYFAFDSLAEIEKLKEHAPDSVVYLRLKVSDHGSKFPLSSKFGVDVNHALGYAEMAQDAGLKMKGLTFHVGSQSENPRAWEAAIKTAGQLIEDMANAGITIEFLNLGGGLPANYEDVAVNVKDVTTAINKALQQYIPQGVRIMAEPGRYISANSSVLVTSVIGREHRSGADWVYLDMGVFQGLIEPLEIPGWRYPIFTRKHRKGYKKSFVLTGPTCDAHDTIGLDYSLPSDLKVGDKVYIGAVGAYSLVYGSNFNGFLVPKTYYKEANNRKGIKLWH